ncbi:MAG: hypothetical protein Ct9H300mP14_07060 [Gammaproteobacteria bacterium]|nr:MAG: hypothetical protein Ct9H300mP14_07060 [Gammaproteobacteria bacterium]
MAAESVPYLKSSFRVVSNQISIISGRECPRVWHPMATRSSSGNPPRIITGAEGVYIEDDEGHRVIERSVVSGM